MRRCESFWRCIWQTPTIRRTHRSDALGKVQKRSDSERLPSKLTKRMQNWQPRANAFCNFSIPSLSKVPRLPRKNNARSHEVLHLSRAIIQGNLKIWFYKMQPLSGNLFPDLRPYMMKMSLTLPLPHKVHLCRGSSNVPRVPLFLNMLQNPRVKFALAKVQNSLAPARKNDAATSKMVRTWFVFTFCLPNVLRITTACTYSTFGPQSAPINMWCL